MNTICKNAVDTYGKELQINQAFEEMAELMVAINYWRRGRVSKTDVLEEIADVAIMCDQLVYIVYGTEAGYDACIDIINQKLQRLDKRLKEYIASANTQKS